MCESQYFLIQLSYEVFLLPIDLRRESITEDLFWNIWIYVPTEDTLSWKETNVYCYIIPVTDIEIHAELGFHPSFSWAVRLYTEHLYHFEDVCLIRTTTSLEIGWQIISAATLPRPLAQPSSEPRTFSSSIHRTISSAFLPTINAVCTIHSFRMLAGKANPVVCERTGLPTYLWRTLLTLHKKNRMGLMHRFVGSTTSLINQLSTVLICI